MLSGFRALVGPPSAPVNVISSVNGTAVNLEWSSPLDTGGRVDIVYEVQCQKCVKDGGQYEECNIGGNVVNGILGAAVGAQGITSGGTTGSGGNGLVSRTGLASIRFIPQQKGLTEPWVNVVNLEAHTNYTFRILVRNGVSHLSKEPLPHVLVNITTNQAGRGLLLRVIRSTNPGVLIWKELARNWKFTHKPIFSMSLRLCLCSDVKLIVS